MKYYIIILTVIFLNACTAGEQKTQIILDTDANNELDDQHAIAYLIGNDDIFIVKGITTNRTSNGGPVEEHTKEAERIVHLCGADGQFPVLSGANGAYNEIKEHLQQPDFDGHEAVDFIIKTALASVSDEKLVLIPVGKLTNIALAIRKEPLIVDKIKVVWLGSNWPAPGEYNLENDTSAINPVIESGVEMWVCTVMGGTAEVRTTRTEINNRMAGAGPAVQAIEGRHGGFYGRLGDYLVNLWEQVEEVRSLFDMAAVATVKNPEIAIPTVVHGPRYLNNEWIRQENATDSVTFFHQYDSEGVMNDFWEVMEKY
jgi:inosine-uridine nucleoside N-ribohydrolase